MTTAKAISNGNTSSTASQDKNVQPTAAAQTKENQKQLTPEQHQALSDELYRQILLSYQWNDFFFG